MNEGISRVLRKWFTEPGAYVLLDGQYGSTGKGVIAAALAECFWERVHIAMNNAGPNSGHTFYDSVHGKKIILKQLPTFSVAARYTSFFTDRILTVLNAGAIIDRDILRKESIDHHIDRIYVHPHAAEISKVDKLVDSDNVHRIASTGQGVGPALQSKLSRSKMAVYDGDMPTPVRPLPRLLRDKVCFLEVSQGYSLGINAGFYPHTTTRECSVAQALSDAGLPPNFHRRTIMALRTYPIRVGNTENSSGPCYPDQEEKTWYELGLEPEMTTVTGRVRRVFTWSARQYEDALVANEPDVIFLNFCNYIRGDVEEFVQHHVLNPYMKILDRSPEAILLGFGPTSRNIRVYGATGVTW